jgi:hypothetical protein
LEKGGCQKFSGIDIKAEISFIADQIKDSTSGTVDEDQMELEFKSGKKKGLTVYPKPCVGAAPWVGCPR